MVEHSKIEKGSWPGCYTGEQMSRADFMLGALPRTLLIDCIVSYSRDSESVVISGLHIYALKGKLASY